MSITDDELKAAMTLNECLANRRSPALADDLISVGNETIVKQLPLYDRSRGSFSTFVKPYLKRDHRRAQIDICVGVYVPHRYADYNAKIDGKGRFEIDAVPDWQREDQPTSMPKDHARDVREALSMLGAEERKLLELFYMEGLSGRALARRFKVSRAVISQRVVKARKALLAVYQRG